MGASPRDPESYAEFKPARPLSGPERQRLELRAAEHNARRMLEKHRLPQPDEIECGDACIRLLWHEPKLALVVELAQASPNGDLLELVPSDPSVNVSP